MYESSRGNTNPLSQPAAHTKNKSSLNEVLCTGFYSCHTLIQRLAAGFFLSQQTLIRFYWCHRTDCWLCCLQFKTCFALKQNGGGESPSAVCSRDLQSLQRTYCTWYSFLLCVCVCVCLLFTVKGAVVRQEVPAVLRLSFPVHHPGAHGEGREGGGGTGGRTTGWPMKEKKIVEPCGPRMLQNLIKCVM